MNSKLTTPSKSSFLLRIFSISVLLFTVLPLLILLFLYLQFEDTVSIEIPNEQLCLIIIILCITIIPVLWGLRKILKNIITLNVSMKKALFEKVDKDIISKLVNEEGEIAELAKTFSNMIDKMDTTIHELEQTKVTLFDVVTKVGNALITIENFNLLLQLILETTMNALGVVKGVVFSKEEDNNYSIKTFIGFEDITEDAILKATKDSILWVTSKKKRILLDLNVSDIQSNDDILGSPLIFTPLISKNNIWGALCLSGKQNNKNFTEDEIRLISNLSNQMAISFENVALNDDMEKTYFETIAALALAAEAKDSYARGHSDRVGEYAFKVGQSMGLNKTDLNTLRDAAKLHDIGKIGIADKVLKKPGRYSVEEMEIMKNHTIIGESIVKPLKTFHNLLNPIRHHHEMLDGSGYPDGLSGNEISTITRILTVADIFDAITSDRIYRNAFNLDETKIEFQSLIEKGKLDRQIVECIFRLLEEDREILIT